MLYFVESNLRYDEKINTICGGKKLDKLIAKIINTGDACKVDIHTENGVPKRGEIETQTWPGVTIKFIKIDDFPECEEKIINYINKILEKKK